MNNDLHAAASSVFQTSVQSNEPGPTFARDFASRKLEQDIAILDMPQRNLVPAWEKCVQTAMTAKVVVEEELSGSVRAQVHLCNLSALAHHMLTRDIS